MYFQTELLVVQLKRKESLLFFASLEASQRQSSGLEPGSKSKCTAEQKATSC